MYINVAINYWLVIVKSPVTHSHRLTVVISYG